LQCFFFTGTYLYFQYNGKGERPRTTRSPFVMTRRRTGDIWRRW
jgi:hypothetical protein